MNRENCPYRERCGKTGHYSVPGVGIVRCACLEQEILKKELGPLATDKVLESSPLSAMASISVVMDGDLRSIRPHASRVVIDLKAAGKKVKIIDCYRFLEIFLEKDAEFTTTSQIEADLLVVLLGFGDPPNRYLPQLVIQVLDRRRLEDKPTWVILGLQLTQVPTRYNQELYNRLAEFKKVNTK